MDKPLSVHQKKKTKQTKAKRKSVKVVYISNPIKVETSASEFRALVQELTGQDAEMPDPAKFSEIDGVGGSQESPDAMKVMDDHVHALEIPTVDPGSELPKRSDLSMYDDVFMHQMLENFPGLLPSNAWYESPHVDVLKSLDAV